jgi:hypothetical protein
MGDYISTRKSWSDSALRSLFKNIFSKLAPTSPEVSIEPDISGLEITRFKNGRTTYITLLQDMIGETDGTKYGTKALPEKKESAQIKVKIKKPGHVYNARNGKYHGKTKEFETTIKELEGEVFAVLPYKVEKIDLNIESSRVKQGDVFSYEIKLATENDIPAEEHILEVSFYDPNGQEIKHYRKKLAMKGSIKDNVSLALNEKTGKWKVKVKDIASKIESSSEFEVIELKK